MIRKLVIAFRILIVRGFHLLDIEYYSRFNLVDGSRAGAMEKHFVEIGAARKVAGIRCINVPRVFDHNIMKKIMGFAIYQHYIYNDIRIHNLDEIFTVPESVPTLERNENFFVEVLVPVYGAIDSVSRCLQSLSIAKTSINHTVCVIDDATPSTTESTEIKKLCTEYGFEYAKNETNLGFVKTANIGLSRTSGNSLLLNSDTIVFDGWLEAFESVVSSEVGTVTCLSNNATIYSIPLETDSRDGEIKFSGQLAKNLKILDLPPIEIPTAHGFCLLITKQAKQVVGLFDEKSFGHGYGEENDYSLRVSKHGLTNVLTPKTLVFHEGSASFGSTVSARQEKATRNLLQMWPDYLIEVQTFLARNEMRELVAKTRLQTIKMSNKETVVHFGHNLGGGVDVAIMGEIYNQDKNLENSIWIKPSGKAMDYSVSVHDMGGNSQEFEIWGVTPEQLASHLNQLALKAVIVHHQIGYEQLPEILNLLKQRYIFRAHDYNAFCPFNNFVTAEGDYCGEPDDSTCNQCIFDREPEFLDIQTWRIAKAQILMDAKLVTAPSTDSKTRIEKYLKRTDVAVRPNERPHSLASNVRSRPVIAMFGVLNVPKGLLNAVKIMSYLREEFRFVLVGSVPELLISSEIQPLIDDGTFTILGNYSDDTEAFNKLNIIKPVAVFFPGRIPETYSFTLDIANQSKLPIFAYDIGAIPERITVNEFVLLSLSDTPETVSNVIRKHFE